MASDASLVLRYEVSQDYTTVDLFLTIGKPLVDEHEKLAAWNRQPSNCDSLLLVSFSQDLFDLITALKPITLGLSIFVLHAYICASPKF